MSTSQSAPKTAPRTLFPSQPKSSQRTWQKITAEANSVGAGHLLFDYGFCDETYGKIRLQKRFPKLAKEIDLLCGKDRFISAIKAEQSADRLKVFLSIIFVGFSVAVPALMIPSIITIISLRWAFKPDYKAMGFNDEEIRYYER